KGKVEAFRQMEEAASLSADIGFVSRALTRGVPRALGQAVRGDPWGAARASAIVAGIALAGAGHLAGQGSLLASRRRARGHTRSSRGGGSGVSAQGRRRRAS
ncbi:MAG TPA: hypothetical protein VEG62_01295, partial [Acidimicrobiales bacterium]|nr:hypothetical protein [Acidimicrobiales bacterium]